jgi:hypothetical protein
MKDPLDQLFNLKSEAILVYLGKEYIADPNRKNVEVTEFKPVVIRALVFPLTPTSAFYKMRGIEVNRALELIIHKRHLNELTLCQHIDYDGISYYGWKKNNKMVYRKEGAYYRVLVYSQ